MYNQGKGNSKLLIFYNGLMEFSLLNYYRWGKCIIWDLNYEFVPIGVCTYVLLKQRNRNYYGLFILFFNSKTAPWNNTNIPSAATICRQNQHPLNNHIHHPILQYSYSFMNTIQPCFVHNCIRHFSHLHLLLNTSHHPSFEIFAHTSSHLSPSYHLDYAVDKVL